MNRITVRQAVLADLDRIAPLFDAYRQFQGEVADLAAAREFLLERFDHGESVVFVALDADDPDDADDAALGFAQLYPSYSSVALARVFILNDLFVHPLARRAGVASRLLAAVEGYAWRLGAARVTLNVARSNLSAQALYRARGWTQDEVFHMFHRFADRPEGGSP
jgi:GNAT superfamily N-acetyltransferase